MTRMCENSLWRVQSVLVAYPTKRKRWAIDSDRQYVSILLRKSENYLWRVTSNLLLIVLLLCHSSHFTVIWNLEPLRPACVSVKELLMLHSHTTDMTMEILVICDDNCCYLKVFCLFCPIFSQFSERWRVRHGKSQLPSVINNQLYHSLVVWLRWIPASCKLFLQTLS